MRKKKAKPKLAGGAGSEVDGFTPDSHHNDSD